jgi:hypothetical protein
MPLERYVMYEKVNNCTHNQCDSDEPTRLAHLQHNEVVPNQLRWTTRVTSQTIPQHQLLTSENSYSITTRIVGTIARRCVGIF